MGQKYPSVLLENAVNEFARLPGIGRKTALRLVLHLLKQPSEDVVNFGEAIIELRSNVHYCEECHNLCNQNYCDICSDPHRDRSLICVVENIKDVMAIENTGQYKGLYHVLGGIISPMDGISPGDLQISSLVDRAKNENTTEIILALSSTMEGDTTNFYIFRKLAGVDIKISMIARGIAVGDELEYADEITLGRSILNRTIFSDSFKT